MVSDLRGLLSYFYEFEDETFAVGYEGLENFLYHSPNAAACVLQLDLLFSELQFACKLKLDAEGRPVPLCPMHAGFNAEMYGEAVIDSLCDSILMEPRRASFDMLESEADARHNVDEWMPCAAATLKDQWTKLREILRPKLTDQEDESKSKSGDFVVRAQRAIAKVSMAKPGIFGGEMCAAVLAAMATRVPAIYHIDQSGRVIMRRSLLEQPTQMLRSGFRRFTRYTAILCLTLSIGLPLLWRFAFPVLVLGGVLLAFTVLTWASLSETLEERLEETADENTTFTVAGGLEKNADAIYKRIHAKFKLSFDFRTLSLLAVKLLLFLERFLPPAAMTDERDAYMTRQLFAVSMGRPSRTLKRLEARYVDAEGATRYLSRRTRFADPSPEQLVPPAAGASDAVFAVVDARHVPGIVQRWKAACAAAEEQAHQSMRGDSEPLS